jgi:hypothetical protein
MWEGLGDRGWRSRGSLRQSTNGCRKARPARRIALMAMALATLLSLSLTQSAGASAGAARRLSYSLTPSSTMPYTPCPPGGRMIECNIVIDPPAVQTPSGYKIPGVASVVEGGGLQGGYDPRDIQSAYSIPASGGSGQTVALIDAYSYTSAESDLAKYREEYGLEPCTTANGCFKKVNEKGEEKNYPVESEELEQKLLESDWQLESALDLDMVSAACPHCHITLVEATTQNPKDTAASAEEAAKLGATEISNSYGYPENNETYCPAKKGCMEYLADYNHSGIPVTVSSGDSGYNDGEAGAPSWPATSPNVIAVGGTSLKRAKNSRGWAESVWSGSGSGCSLYETKPTWQKDTGCAKRTDNDVSAVANNETPVSVYRSGWMDVGGTSVASPLVAAIEAHANSATKSAGAEAFYKKPGMLFDITEGSNGTCTPPAEHAYLCAAGSGYDGPTGWGTPNGVFHLSGWADQTIGNLSAETNTKTSSLLGTSCPVAESCTAVGHYTDNSGTEAALAEQWNGTTWSIQETPQVNKSSLSSVWCTSTSSCTAVGHHVSSSGVEIGLAEHWNGAGWSIEEVATPSGAKGFSLSGVACMSVSIGFEVSEECTAAGHYVNSSGVEVTLVEHGTGGFWSVVESPNPTGAKSSSLAGIGCESFGSGQACMAVGREVNSTGTEVTLAEVWLGGSGKWTISETPNPTGAKGSSLSSVSCPGACYAVGRYVNSSGIEVTLVEHWPLEKWTIEESPNPTGAKGSRLSGVSCTAAEACTAVGHYINSSGAEVTLAEGLSAKVWSVVESPNPTGAKSSGLAGISCSAAEACTAAGSYINSSSAEATFAERWSSTKKWAVQETSTPKLTSGDLWNVSCTTSEACTSVGHHLNSSATEVTLAERWNGKEWALQESPNPTGAKGSSLSGVSCASSTSCIAVGRYLNSSSVEVALAESWNGTAWSLKEPVIPTGAKSSKLVGVSCTSSTSCIAVGAYVNSGGTQVTLGESWNGTAWSLKEPLNPTGAQSASLSDVSCVSSTSCIATGRYVNSGSTEVTLAESWNGTAWSLKEPVNPTGAKGSSLIDVSCTSSTACVAVGRYVNSSGTEVALAESWNGTAWSLKEPVIPTGATLSILIGVSCTSSTSCIAVGDYFNSGGTEVTLAESWNGTAWTIQETPNPEATGSWLSGVSCTSSTACIASGRSTDGAGLETALAEEHS